MKSKEPGLNKRNSRRKEVDQTIKNAPRDNPVSIVEQTRHIQDVNALQRKQSVSSVEKRDIMALFASPKPKEEMLTNFQPSLSMRP